MSHAQPVDFLVVGAGIAGASIADTLASRGSVAVFEAEPHAGYHTTGRSAALYSALYGNEVIRALTRASRPFLFHPPDGFAPTPLVTPRATLYFARADQMDGLVAFVSTGDVARGAVMLDAEEAQALVPVFKPGYLAGAAFDPHSADIDVDALHQGFLRRAKARGAQLHLGCGVRHIRCAGARWIVQTGAGEWTAPVLVNAAGAWGDEVAALAGVPGIGLQPLRRTALLIDSPEGRDCAAWPAAIDVDEQFYFKPDAGLLLLSPADEHPSPPCDAQPDELDVAVAVDRFEQATGLPVRRVRHKWAGLRVFSPDRSPVVGFDPRAPGFFWLVGQGGYGIQTAPAMGLLAAALACGDAAPDAIAAAGVDLAALSPERYRS